MTEAEMDFCLKLIEKDEEFRQFPYDDATGKTVNLPHSDLTIGIGLNLETSGIERNEALYLLRNRVEKLERRLIVLTFWKDLDIVRKTVLISMAFNLGMNGLLKFKNMLRAIEERDFNRAADEIIDSNAAKQLQTRYQRFAKMMRTGKAV